MIKAQYHWAKDIEHFGTDELRVLELQQKELFKSSDFTPLILTFNCVKIDLIVTMKMINRTLFFFLKMAHRTIWFSSDEMFTVMFTRNKTLPCLYESEFEQG